MIYAQQIANMVKIIEQDELIKRVLEAAKNPYLEKEKRISLLDDIESDVNTY